MKEMSRRAFLSGSAAAGLGVAAFGLAACAPSGDGAEKGSEGGADEPKETAKTYEPSQTVECDMVVVGGGNSGMSACLEGVEQGLNVVLLEKEPNLGGTLFGTEGILGLGSQLQIEKGIELPDRYQMVKEELEYTNYRTDPLLWNDVIGASGEDIDWLQEKGVKFPVMDNYLGQSAYSTFHWWEGETGALAVETLAGIIMQSGATVMTGTPAVDLKVDGGKVVGVYAEAENGDIVEVNAKAVVLASGGIANDLELLGQKMGWDLSEAQSLFPIHNVGDGLRMATGVGAKEDVVSLMNVFSVRNHAPTDPITIGGTMQPVSLYVNEQGERFLSEDLCLKKFFALLTNAFNAQKQGFSIIDQSVVDRMEGEGCFCGVAAVKAGDKLTGLKDQLEEACKEADPVAFRGETVAELAEAMGVDPKTLEATVTRYNELCAAGKDEDYGKDPAYLEPLEKGPFYAVTPVFSIFQTMGGVSIDRNMRVVNENGEPIEGLYSAGTTSCGLYKETYCYQVSGGMNAYCCYTGRNAARQIAASI